MGENGVADAPNIRKRDTKQTRVRTRKRIPKNPMRTTRNPPRAQILRLAFRTSGCPGRRALVAHQSGTLSLVGPVDDQGDFRGGERWGRAASGGALARRRRAPTGSDQRGARRQGALAPPRTTRSSTPQGSFWGGLRVFGRLRRFFVCCNRVRDNPPQTSRKKRFFQNWRINA